MPTLLRHGADPMQVDKQGLTPMHHAAHRSLEACTALIEHVEGAAGGGEEPKEEEGEQGAADASTDDAGDEGGDGGECTSCAESNEAADAGPVTVQRMVTATDKAGNTPLHLAAKFNKGEICKLLLSKGADANAKNAAGLTPLHEAALLDSREAWAALLDNGADCNVPDADGVLPRQVAEEKGHNALVEVLEDRLKNMLLEQDVAEAKRLESESAEGESASGGE